MELILILLGALAIILLLVFYNAFAWGYVSSIIYTWFIIPIFPETPVLTWMQLAGIMFLVNCFVHNTTTNYIKKDYKDETTGLILGLISPWFTLFFAWIFKTFIY